MAPEFEVGPSFLFVLMSGGLIGVLLGTFLVWIELQCYGFSLYDWIDTWLERRRERKQVVKDAESILRELHTIKEEK